MRAIILTFFIISSQQLLAQTRPPAVAETSELAEMQYQGIISAKNEVKYALVKMPGGNVHRLKVFSDIGKHYGRIVNIDLDRLYVAEILPKCQQPDEWRMRMNYLNLNNTEVNPRYQFRTETCFQHDDVEVINKELLCDKETCEVKFTLRNHLLHSIFAHYEIILSNERKTDTGQLMIGHSGRCQEVHRLVANETITKTNSLRAKDKANSVYIKIDLGMGEKPVKGSCLLTP